MKIKSVNLIQSVMFANAADMTLIARNGDQLELQGEFIVATPSRADRDPLWIPMSNVKSFTPLTERAAKALTVQAAPVPTPKPQPPPRSALGVKKFVKLEDGTIEEKLV